ncbi:MAG: patatin-like phospholipase family protein [Patescibacteria group bacterium]|nr:patatin-like phospholipase family protein [Patescibacteria group bacterium]
MENNNEKSAIVIVGGAFRSTYYSGSLRALDELGIGNQFDLYVGLSAGAPVMSYFLAEQLDEMPFIWREFVPTKLVYNPKNIFKKKPIIDLDYLIDEVFWQKKPINIDKLKDKNFLVPLVNYTEGNIEYFKSDHENFKEILKASMCIPWISKKTYEIENTKFVDAGIAENLVIKKLLEDGYSKILVLINHSGLHDIKNWKEVLIEKLFLISNPKIRKIFKKILIENIKENLNIFNNKNNKIITISPTKYHVSKFENSKDKLEKNIEQGYIDIMENPELKDKLLNLFSK